MNVRKIINKLGTFDEKRYILSLVVVLLIILILTVVTNLIHTTVTEQIVISDIITQNNLFLNKKNYFTYVSQEFEIELSNPEKVKYQIEIENPEIVSNDNNTLKSLAVGKTNYSIIVNNVKCFNGVIFVVKGIEKMPELYNKKKPYISCNEFSDEENQIIDMTLEDRVSAAGKNTRAGVVAAARFLTMEFSYRIAYFYENGRLNNYGDGNHVDGEGRYYHEGLYLSPSKYAFIEKKFTGPGAWGCKITQYQDEPKYGFVPRVKYPNGFDCSGFISWVLLNGGFDVKDSGAGDNPRRDDDLYDLGEKRYLNKALLDSGEVKVGDLIAYQGHMAIIAGIDMEGNYYVAESLPQFKGVVLNKYRPASLIATFSHIMLMDSVYQNDGNLTNMWY